MLSEWERDDAEEPSNSNLPARDNQDGTRHQYGELAQLGERLVCNQEVTGSSPVFSTSLIRELPIDDF